MKKDSFESFLFWTIKKALSVSSKLSVTGDDLLSHKASPAVSWALIGLTDVFGMGTGVALKDIDTRWLYFRKIVVLSKLHNEREG